MVIECFEDGNFRRGFYKTHAFCIITSDCIPWRCLKKFPKFRSFIRGKISESSIFNAQNFLITLFYWYFIVHLLFLIRSYAMREGHSLPNNILQSSEILQTRQIINFPLLLFFCRNVLIQVELDSLEKIFNFHKYPLSFYDIILPEYCIYSSIDYYPFINFIPFLIWLSLMKTPRSLRWLIRVSLINQSTRYYRNWLFFVVTSQLSAYVTRVNCRVIK